MVYLWRGGSDVALQCERLRAQNLDPACDPLGDRVEAVRRTDRDDAAVRSGHGDLARTDPAYAGPGGSARAEHAGEDRAVRTAGFQYLLYHPLRVPAQQGGLSQPPCLER